MIDELKVVEIYERMLELPDEQREAFILRELPDEESRRLLEQLAAIEIAQGEGRNLAPGEEDYAQEKHVERRALVGSTIGAYQLVSILGHGGSATVYLAERIDQRYKTQVAIKVLEHAAAVRAERVKSEFQFLADLSHPDIARILDAGELVDGRPYVIMEFVEGMPVDHYCDHHKLSINQRLKLFLRICAAVQFAHQRLVIHRDLKPLNLLITSDQSPKLLDFGIATLLGAADANRTGAFALDRVQLTADFASPEQVRGEPLTTASDVYSLGVILYGLLCGLSVYDSESRKDVPVEDSVLNFTPMLASDAVIAGLNEPLRCDLIELLAQARGLTARKLARQLKGDLDAILRRALSKDVQTRYHSVEQLAADIRSYLSHDVVEAREGTWVYAASRFVRRNHWGVTAASVFVGVMTVSATALFFQNQRIRVEHARAEKVSEFMLNVFAASDPFVNHGKEMTAGELLEQAGRRIRTDPTLQASVRADLLQGIGRAYRRQALPEESIPYLEEALQLRTSELNADPLQLATVYAELALAYRSAGRLKPSEAAFANAMHYSSESKQTPSATRVQLLTEIGRLEVLQGHLNVAGQRFEEALRLARQIFGDRHAEVASILLDRANLAYLQDDYTNAVRWAQQAVTLNEQVLPVKHPDRIMSQYILASILSQAGKLDRAKELLEEVLPSQRQLYGRNSPKVADTLDALGVIYRQEARYQEAEKYSREALKVMSDSQSSHHYMVGYFHVQLALTLLDQRELEQAKAQLEDAISVYRETLPEDHEYRAAAEHWLGEVALAQGQYDLAESALEQAIGTWKRTGAPQWRVARSLSTLGEVYAERGECDRALPLLDQSVKALSSDRNADPKMLAIARHRLQRLQCAPAANS